MKKIIFLFLLTLSYCPILLFSQTLVTDLLTENLSNPVGIDTKQPRFTWKLNNKNRNMVQTAYEIKVENENANVWNSGKIVSDSSVYVTYKGSPLQSGNKYNWQVRVWDNSGEVSEWSQKASFQMALLNISDWKAKWIEPGFIDTVEGPSPLLRKEFNSGKNIKSAALYITSHGLYEAYINGKQCGNFCLTPGWTSYNKRLQYQVYDVTNLIQQGNNAIGVMLGSGWYRSELAWNDNKNLYGKKVGLLFQMDIHYTDGTSEIVISDNSWKSSTGEIIYSEIYNGEIIDARKAKTGWMLPGYNDKDWENAKVANYSLNNLLATYNEPIRKHETFKPLKIFITPKGEKVIDFGQNLVGWTIVKVNGNSGNVITLSHAEVLDKEGNFYTENLRGAKAQNKYILNGGGEEVFRPHFTWQGYRYLKVEGYPGELKPENFEAVALYSDMRRTGTFTTSNKLINQLQHNIEWGQKGNFLDVPTDCPQRDERLGWTGDAQAFARTASFNMDVHNFFTKWLRDLEADQIDGLVPHVIPNVLNKDGNSAGWADASTIVPWTMYIAYGDKRILENQYNSMKAFVESVRHATKNDLWNTGFHFGDWLFFRPFDDNDGRSAVTDKNLIAQCFYAHSTQLLINTAKILGKLKDAVLYDNLLKKIKAAFNREYVTASGRLVSSTQTAYVLALNFDMLPESLRKKAAERLVENVQSYGNHLTTGFLGTPYLCHVLTKYGYTNVAYKLLLQDDYPSWLYPVKAGATTIWERWDGQRPDGTFQNSGMNSFNHYAYGAIGDWMYRKMVGIDTYEDGAGYKHIKIMPYIGGELKNASASLKTYYGTVSNSWYVDGNKISMNVEIPVNTKATIFIPANNIKSVTESGKALSAVQQIKILGKENDYIKLEMGSGKYQFRFTKKIKV